MQRRRSKGNEEHGKGKSGTCRGGGVREMRSVGGEEQDVQRRRSKRNEEHGKGNSRMCRGGGVREMRSMGRGRAGCAEEEK